MPKFVTLGSWTDQGVRKVGDTAKRYQAFVGALKDAGGRMVDMSYTLGPYDFVATYEAPDDETATAIMLKTAALGNIRTTTMRAFDIDEVKGLLKRARL